MIPVTMTLAVVACLLALALPPVWSVCVYLVVLLGYSQNLTVPLGPLDFTVSRIVIFVVILSILARGRQLAPFRLLWLDFWVAVFYLGCLVSLLANEPMGKILERQSGVLVDTILPYLAVRLAITSHADLMRVIKVLAIVGLPLALMGAYQSVTGNNPVGFMENYYGFGMNEMDPYAVREMRYGLSRADVTMGNAIIFGLFFALVIPLVFSLWRKAGARMSTLLILGILMLGLLSSLSSAPIFSLVVALGFISAYPLRRYWPVGVTLMLVFLAFTEMYSDGHFYHVLTRFAFSANTAYYRIGLFEEAFGGGMRGHWLTGYGFVGVGPGNDNTNFDWVHLDLVNIYINILARHGLLGLLPFLAINVLYYRALVRAGRQAVDEEHRWTVWCLAGALIGWNCAMMTVSALNQINTILFMFIGVAANMPQIVSPARRSVLVAAPERRRRVWRSAYALGRGMV